MLDRAGITVLLDVRSFPGSRRNPQFGRELMAKWVPQHGIEYRWRRNLGGRRRLPKDAPPCGWTHPSFSAYAWYMRTPEWLDGMQEVIGQFASIEGPAAAMMCSESVWWRCHRSMICDYLTFRGIAVRHLPSGKTHAEVLGDRLQRYPPSVIETWKRYRAGEAAGSPTASVQPDWHHRGE